MNSLGFKTKAKREEERQAKLPVLSKGHTPNPSRPDSNREGNLPNANPLEILHFKAQLALAEYFSGNSWSAEETFFERVKELRKAAMLFKEKM